MFSENIDQTSHALAALQRDNDSSFRRYYLPSDIKVARNVLVIVSVMIGLFIISDYIFVNLSLTLLFLAGIRMGLIILCIYSIRLIERPVNFRSYDRACLFVMLAVGVGLLVINSTRPYNFLPQVIIVDVAVLVMYLIVPTKFVYQVIAASVLSIGQAVILLSIAMQVTAGIFTTPFSILLSNLIGGFISWQIHSYRWELFQNNLRYKESERLITIGQTAGMVGHDIRNPLQAMVGDVFLAKSELDELQNSENKDRIKESLDSIENSITYVKKIVQDLQDYSRPLAPNKRTMDVQLLFNEVLPAQAIPKTIVVSKIVLADAKTIFSDPDLLKRALANLVNNAVQAMPNGGKLDLVAYRKANKVMITVQDTGGGIPEDVRARIFTPLVTTKAKGQGFGLPVVKRMTEALGGNVTFETQVGTGTKFTIELPVDE